jgi:ornithine cyclodeaminase/alanine dehydrogenase-like protein (mu-crystallin family)
MIHVSPGNGLIDLATHSIAAQLGKSMIYSGTLLSTTSWQLVVEAAGWQPAVQALQMKVLILNHSEVEALLPMNECISVMEQAFAALSRNEFHQPLRTIIKPSEVKGVMALMPTFRSGNEPLFALKAICVFPGNAAIDKDAHQGGVLLFDGRTGELLAVVNASAITSIRTAAVSGLATQLLANPDASELAIIGSGVQARSHLQAMACVRPIRRARIASLRLEKAQAFVREVRDAYDFPIEAVSSPEEAVREANLIVTATIAREPVLKREWIRAGAHINAVGTYSPKARELDGATMAAAALFVDRRESAVNEAGDYILAVAEGAIPPDHIRAELCDVVTRSHAGRTSIEEITIFKSLGLAIEDLAAAAYIYQKAADKNLGKWIDF